MSYQGLRLTADISPEEVEAAKTSRGGWTRATLAEWGAPWPLPNGWRRELRRNWERRGSDEKRSLSCQVPLPGVDRDP